MNKSEIVSKVAESAGITKIDAEVAVNATLKAIQQGVEQTGKVQFVGFGTFKKVTRKAREGRNPQTGATILIPAKDVIKFTPSK